MVVKDIGAPMDVLWLRLSRRDTDPHIALGHIGPGHILVMLFRGDYWQCGFVIAKGQLESLKQQGIEAFRKQIAELAPFTADRVGEITDWGQVRLLTVSVDRLEKW